MALYPKAVLRLIPPGVNDPPITAVGAILHVDAGNALTLYEYFRDRSGGVESHFFIRRDGVVEQYRDTGWEADANWRGNSFEVDGVLKGYVSIETQGYGNGLWAPEQLASIKELLVWLSEEHDFPLEVPATPVSPGVGFHTLFGAPGAWTPVAKSCPGPQRIIQFRDDLVPWMWGREQLGDPFPKIRRRLRARLRAARTEQRKAWIRSILKAIRKGPR